MIDAAPYAAILERLHSDGWTDRDLAKAMGFSSTCVNLIRRGVTRRIYPSTANPIAAMSIIGQRVSA